MRSPIVPRLPKWPFFLGDAILLAIACFIAFQTPPPFGRWEMLACVFAVALAAAFGALPFVLEYRAIVKLAEAEGLTDVVSQIEHLEQLAAQIGYATNQWQVVRESADKTAGAAKEIAQGMAAEVKSFNEFVQRTNDSEKAALRLEVEKLRRAEADWLQVIVRILDHVYALHCAAVHSRQPALIEQLGQFQNSCRDVARRVGLAPFVAAPREAFDERRHELIEPGSQPTAGALVEETVATGYTFQGKLLRPAMVRIQNGTRGDARHAGMPVAGTEPKTPTAQSQLPLQAEAR